MNASTPETKDTTPQHDRVESVQRIAALISRAMDRAITLACAAIVVFLCVSTSVGVVYRYVLEQPLGWPEETARFGLVWLSLLAAARALRRGQHIALGFVVARLPLVVRTVLRDLVNIGIIVFLAGFVYQAVEYLDIVGPTKATTTGISMLWPYLGLVVSFSALLLIAALDVIDAICAHFTGTTLSLAALAAEEGVEMLSANPVIDRVEEPDLSKEHRV